MNKLEAGMYVRTKYGIAKIINIFDKENLMNICGRIQTEKYGLDEKDITKASHNIIDLIEVGDYVNGSLVVDKWEEPDWYGYFIKLEGEETIPTIRKIETIVTKQQMESMQYEVK